MKNLLNQFWYPMTVVGVALILMAVMIVYIIPPFLDTGGKLFFAK